MKVAVVILIERHIYRYLNDEMTIEAGWGPELRAHYRWTVDTAPSHITWACLGADATVELRQYLDTSDVLATDKYPICQAYNASAVGVSPVSTIGQEVALARSSTDAARPLWQVIQAMCAPAPQQPQRVLSTVSLSINLSNLLAMLPT